MRCAYPPCIRTLLSRLEKYGCKVDKARRAAFTIKLRVQQMLIAPAGQGVACPVVVAPVS